jgi:hypothetical protein
MLSRTEGKPSGKKRGNGLFRAAGLSGGLNLSAFRAGENILFIL